jgi:hypothetical protein
LGPVFYGLWGVLHIIGALVLWQQLSAGGAPAVLATIGSGVPPVDVPVVSSDLLKAVLAYYTWHIFWAGLAVLGVAVKLNWQNRRAGYWFNLLVVGLIDLGLVLLLIVPGYMAVTDGGLGLALFLPAVIFSTMGRLNQRRLPDLLPI